MPYSPDSDPTDPHDAPRSTDSAPTDETSGPGSSRDGRPAHWARRARTGSAATAVAALAALGGSSVAHAAPAPHVQVASSPVLVGQKGPKTPEHTVSPGDSLWAIAQHHGVEVSELMRWNDLSGAALLHPGQKLRLAGEDPATPAPKRTTDADQPAVAQPAAAREHVVRPGDSLWSISEAHGVSVQDLLDTNDITVGSLLRPGQRLAVTDGGTGTVRPASEPGSTPGPAPEPAPEPERAVGDTFAGRTYSERVVDSANRHHEQLQSRPAPSRAEIRRLVHDTAVRMGVDPSLALAHAYQESGFNHRVVSPADAVGTMQVIPDAGEWASGMVGRDLDLLDPQDNVTAGVAIIRQLGRSAPSTDVAIAAYYQGLHGVQKYGMYDDTKKYVKNVKAHRASFRE